MAAYLVAQDRSWPWWAGYRRTPLGDEAHVPDDKSGKRAGQSSGEIGPRPRIEVVLTNTENRILKEGSEEYLRLVARRTKGCEVPPTSDDSTLGAAP